MTQNKDDLYKEIKESMDDYRKALIDLKEHKHNKFYKSKFSLACKRINKIRLVILKDRNFARDKTLSFFREKTEMLVKSNNMSEKEKTLEEIEDKMDGNQTPLEKQDISITEKFYDGGHQYDFYSDVKEMLSKANKRVFIVDSYLDEDLLDIYFKKVPQNIEINILTNSNSPKGNFPKIARMFSRKHKGKFETRESPYCHDRAIFIDNHGWVIGQSIKDLAKNKPSYLRKLDSPEKLEKFFKRLWNNSKKVV